MKSLKVAGLCLASMFVLGMALAGAAEAVPLWMVCLPWVSSPTKYSTNQCTTASGTGAWESRGLKSTEADTVTIKGFTMRLTDLKAGPFKEKATIKCNGASEGRGLVESGGKGKITEAKVGNAKTNCERTEGPCKTGEVESVEGANLPWDTTIASGLGGTFETKIENSGAGEPGWKIKCNTALGSKTDECLSESASKAEQVELKSETTGGVLLVRGVFKKAHNAKCSEAGGATETGEIEGSMAILLTSGNGLSINPL
jgi:hypothetical protein